MVAQLLTLKLLMTNSRFFYALLYASECSSEEAEFDSFFRVLNIPSIDTETSSRLDEPFTVDEIKGITY